MLARYSNGINPMKSSSILFSVFICTLFVGCASTNGTETTTTVKKDNSIFMQIFMFPDATQIQIDNVKNVLEEDIENDELTSYEYFNRDEAYKFFLESFAEDEELISSVKKEDIPVNFLVKMTDRAEEKVSDLVFNFSELEGVDKVSVQETSAEKDHVQMTETTI